MMCSLLSQQIVLLKHYALNIQKFQRKNTTKTLVCTIDCYQDDLLP